MSQWKQRWVSYNLVQILEMQNSETVPLASLDVKFDTQ
jgi:hypothetical protein